jgi:MYXO-CTERM domain-containing protein
MRSTKTAAISLCALGTALVPTQAQAISISASDCNFGFQDVYNAGDAVCVTGELDVVPPMGICAEAYVIVTPVGSANPFFDVSMGGANYVLGCAGAGAFFDEYVWLPPLVPGQYDLVIDQFPFFGAFGAEDLRQENAFSVSNAPIVFSVDVAAIKGAAMQGLAEAQAMKDLANLLTIIDSLSTVADWGAALGTGGAIAAIGLGVVCYFGVIEHPCATSYNSAVISIGTKIIGHMGDALTLHYGAIILDPPDPDFEDVVPLRYEDALANGAPWAPLAGAAVPTSQTVVGQLLSTQAAAYQALLPTIEKLQGAQIAGDHFGLLIQAEQTQAYAGLALEAGDAMLAELDALQATLEAAGTYSTEVDAGGMLAAIEGGALGEEERALIQSFGFSEADIDAAVAQVGSLPVPGPLSWSAFVDATRGSFENMRPALVDLMGQAEAIRAENEPLALRVAPVADLSAPAAAAVGETIMLSGSATHLDPDASLVYAWDLDGDGEFDDAMGPDTDHVAPAPGLVVVAVEVSDGARRDIAMASIMVSVSNVPPEFTAFVPEGYAPFADVGEMVELSATAEDADGDPITYTWYVDDVEAGSGEGFAYAMPDEEFHAVRVVAADDDPYSADAEFTFQVRSSIWEGQVGETGGSGDTGLDGTADGADDGTASGGADAGATDGNDGTAGTGSAGADGGEGGGSGCGCTSGGSSTPAWAGLLMLVLGTGMRRRKR